jgi:hypothetical protein
MSNLAQPLDPKATTTTTGSQYHAGTGNLCGFARRGYVGLPHSLHTPRSGVSVMLPLVIVIAS